MNPSKKVDYSPPQLTIYFSPIEGEDLQYISCSYKTLPSLLDQLSYYTAYIYLGTIPLINFSWPEYGMSTDPGVILEELGTKLLENGEEAAGDFFLHYMTANPHE